MFNFTQCGLQHPGNVVPSCSSCNSNRKKSKQPGHDVPVWAKEKGIIKSGEAGYYTWRQQVALKSDDYDTYKKRKEKITDHIQRYDQYDSGPNHALQAIAKELYDSVTKAITCANKKAKTLPK